MATIASPKRRRLEEAVRHCATSLRRLSEYKLEEPIEQRLLKLSENKEFLTKAQRKELAALVDFWQKRTNEILEARLALKRLSEAFPDLVLDS